MLIQAFDRGLISADQFNQKIKALQDTADGADKGVKEFTSGVSTDVSILIGKLTDFSSIMTAKKGGQSIFSQFSQDANDFIKSLEQLAFKLAIVNPLLNKLAIR